MIPKSDNSAPNCETESTTDKCRWLETEAIRQKTDCRISSTGTLQG